MNLNYYIEACKKFAEDTKEWGGLDRFKHYTSHDTDGWRETSDNAHGGIDVSWAFHAFKSYIITHAAEKLLEYLMADLERFVDEGCDAEQLEALIEQYS